MVLPSLFLLLYLLICFSLSLSMFTTLQYIVLFTRCVPFGCLAAVYSKHGISKTSWLVQCIWNLQVLWFSPVVLEFIWLSKFL